MLTQIRLLFNLHCLPFHVHLLDTLLRVYDIFMSPCKEEGDNVLFLVRILLALESASA